MVEAVNTYTPEQGKSFIGWFAFYLKSAFAEAAGYRTRKGKHDPLRRAVSLYEAVGGEDDDVTIEDYISDPAASEAFENAEERIYTEQLHKALEGILETIPESEANVIRQEYFDGRTVAEIAAERGVSKNNIYSLCSNGLRHIRRNTRLRKGEEFRRFLEDSTPYYISIGVDKFNNTHTSAVEFAVLERERLEELQNKYGGRRR